MKRSCHIVAICSHFRKMHKLWTFPSQTQESTFCPPLLHLDCNWAAKKQLSVNVNSLASLFIAQPLWMGFILESWRDQDLAFLQQNNKEWPGWSKSLKHPLEEDTYLSDAHTLTVVPLVASITLNHVVFVWCLADAVHCWQGSTLFNQMSSSCKFGRVILCTWWRSLGRQ